jgi:hypothetical protein
MRNGILALFVLILATAMSPAQGWAEKMFKGAVSHDFGTVPRGAQLVHRFTITNIYAVRMEITELKTSCGCATATAAKRVLEPLESTTIEVRLDGRRFTGPKKFTVRVSVGPEYISSTELLVTVNSRADVVFNPGEVRFDTVTRGQTPARTIDVEYAGALDWRVTEVVARDVPYDVSYTELYRRPGQVGYRLTVTLKADAPTGALKHNLYLRTNDPASKLVAVLVEANVQMALTVSPSALKLGVVKVDTVYTQRVLVRGSEPFRILAVEGTGDGIELGAPFGAAAASQIVTFRCQPGKPGDFKRQLKIKTSLQDAPAIVTVEGTAVR